MKTRACFRGVVLALAALGALSLASCNREPAKPPKGAPTETEEPDIETGAEAPLSTSPTEDSPSDAGQTDAAADDDASGAK